ncbi:uncharacterized protein Dsimw501_GD17739 [Drosophila simulans]|nr:uncharacterized protein Dsimw501_GD17739 [Drosophila simulans]
MLDAGWLGRPQTGGLKTGGQKTARPQRPRSEDWFCDPQIVVSQQRFNVAHIIHSAFNDRPQSGTSSQFTCTCSDDLERNGVDQVCFCIRRIHSDQSVTYIHAYT